MPVLESEGRYYAAMSNEKLQKADKPQQDGLQSDQLRWTDLETRLAYAEQANDQLSQEIFDQQRESERLQLRVMRLEQRLRELSDQMPAATGGKLEDDIPPHY